MSEQMAPEQAAGLIRKAVSESSRFPNIAFTDTNGLPQSLTLPFAHLNRNYTLVLLMPEAHAVTELMRGQPWIEVQFHTQNNDCFVRFGGRAFVKQIDSAFDKLVEGYPFLASWFEDSKRQTITLVQVYSQIIGVERTGSVGPWFDASYYRVQNGDLFPVTAAGFSEMQENISGQFDIVRRVITRNRGEMIHCVVTNNFEGFSAHIAENFDSPEGLTTEDWINAQWKLYKSIEPGKMSYNWGLNGFEPKRDGSMECRFFLEVLDDGNKTAQQHQEIWAVEGSDWKLFKVF